MRASKVIVWIVAGLAGLVVVLLAFRAGVMVGYRQAQYSSEWEHFHGPVDAAANVRDFLNDHGAIGTITAVDLVSNATTSVTIRDIHENADKIVLVSATTRVIAASTSALRVGEVIAVTGTPNTQGEIVASIIRLLPSPAQQ